MYLPEAQQGLQSVVDDLRALSTLHELHQAAGTGETQARDALEQLAKLEARKYSHELQARGIAPPRFVQFGLHKPEHQSNPRYTFLEWYNLRDIFAEELIRLMGQPHNICVKTPNDLPSPPFSDICATLIADQWDIFNGITRKRHIAVQHRQ